MQVRFARHTGRLEEVVRFYRDGLGLPELGRFEGHDGYDGVFLDLPGTGAHLELTSGGDGGVPVPHEESLLVLYVGDREAIEEMCRRVGVEPVEPANPYWRRNGVALVDPDGFQVVLVPGTWPDGR
jgi:catechol 2,3-dioxygenase-like lactoylglutathione lyase family enzyme